MVPMPSMGVGPGDMGTPPTGNPGLAADAMSKVREVVHLLELALPNLPTGSDPHKDVLDAIGKLSKSVPPSEGIPGIQTTQLAGLQRQAQQSAPLQALARAMGQGPEIAPVGQ